MATTPTASIHHVDQVVELITSVGALVRFLPPYSPNMNPIKEVFAEVKHYLQENGSPFDTTMSPACVLFLTLSVHVIAKLIFGMQDTSRNVL